MTSRAEVALLLVATMMSAPLAAQDVVEAPRANAAASQDQDAAAGTLPDAPDPGVAVGTDAARGQAAGDDASGIDIDGSDPAGADMAGTDASGTDAAAAEAAGLDGQDSAIDGQSTGDVSDPFGDTGSDPGQKSSRVTLIHENSLSTTGAGIVNNRSSVRLEYAKYFLGDFFLQFDSKLTAFWSNDHRAKAQGDSVVLESITPEAYLQYSQPDSNNSYKLGVQKMIWGESEGGAITDVVSPRNASELFLIPLEESRLGQFMVAADRFTEHGHWSAFFVPSPRFNRYPKKGTAYYRPFFPDDAVVRSDPDLRDRHEYGVRWKKVHDRSDFSLMAASLIENDYAYDVVGVDGGGHLLVDRFARRFGMVGATFNHVRGNFQFKGEIAYKSDRSFLDEALRSRSKAVVDSAFGVTYSLGGSRSLGMEWVNSHVVGWNRSLSTTPRNQGSLILNANFTFLSDLLTVNWLTIATRPNASLQSSVRASYQWRESTAFQLDLHVVGDTDRDAALRTYRDTDQVALRVKYQF